MRFSSLLPLAFATLGFSSEPPPTPLRLDHTLNDHYVLQLDSRTDPEQVASRLDLRYEGPLGVLDHQHVYTDKKRSTDVVRDALQGRRMRKRRLGDEDILDRVRWAQKQIPRRRVKRTIPPPNPQSFSSHPLPRQLQHDAKAVAQQKNVMTTLGIEDPIFKDQWHLLNTVEVGQDINCTGVWLQGFTGNGSIVAMVDDGLDMYSDDLKDNYYALGSWDFNDKTAEPKPRLSDDHHGTRCAGEIAAVRNHVCGVGVAYNAKISGLRILSKTIGDADEARAMIYDMDHNHIYSCSWGPPDDGKSMEAPGILIRQAMVKGVQRGRGGLGSIYVFASGNGAANDDNCNFDGYTNSIYSITIGAIDRKGNHPYYSEKCSAQLVVTYSSGSGDAIHTTDVGTNQCYTGHGGTSAAAPLAAGIFALVLQVRPDLTWRDLQWLALITAVPVDLESGDWQPTTMGKSFSHTFGYGKIDTWAIVEAAKTWKNVKPQAWYYSPWLHVNRPIPQGKDGLISDFEVTADMVKTANLARLEHVTVTMNVNHTRRGDLMADLISPDGRVSHIATDRRMDEKDEGWVDWTFMSVVHWGESGIGKWTVVVKDLHDNDFQGVWIDWHLKLFGECDDPAKAVNFPIPQPTDDDHANIATTTVNAVTTPNTHPTTTRPVLSNPSDHIERPTKAGGSGSQASATRPAPPPTGTSPAQGATTSAPSSSWISWLPSFGISSSAQMWIYGALALIVVFCAGLGVYLWLARRRRLRNSPRDEYTFELLNEDEPEGANGEKGPRGSGKRTRGGELYDAFAGESDEEFEEEAPLVRGP